MMVVVIICRQNTNELHHRSKHHKDMENLMGMSEYIELAGPK